MKNLVICSAIVAAMCLTVRVEASGTIYGIYNYYGTTLAGLDYDTGNITAVRQLNFGSWSGDTALDPINQRYFFTDGGSTIYAVDLTDGSMSTLAGKNWRSIEYDSVSNTIYGIYDIVGGMMLAGLDYDTGSITAVRQLNFGSWSGDTALDPINQRYFFTDGGSTIYAVDLTDGSMSSLAGKNWCSLEYYSPIPAPSALLLSGIGVICVSWLRRRRTL